MKQAKFKGHCQRCGKVLTVTRSGVLAHHKFDEYSVCDGAGTAPIETARDSLDQLLNIMRKEATRLEQLGDDYEARRVHVDEFTVNIAPRGATSPAYRYIQWEDASPKQRQRKQRECWQSVRKTAKEIRARADAHERLAKQIHGKPLMSRKINQHDH